MKDPIMLPRAMVALGEDPFAAGGGALNLVYKTKEVADAVIKYHGRNDLYTYYSGTGGLIFPTVISDTTAPYLVKALRLIAARERKDAAAARDFGVDLLFWYVGARFPIKTAKPVAPGSLPKGARDARGRGLFGKPAPAPSGPPSSALKSKVLKAFKSRWFKFKLNIYAKIAGKGKVDWNELAKLVKSAEFKEYANAWEALQSLGYAGMPKGKLIIGVAKPLRKIPILGKSAIQHELVHVYQELTKGALTKEALRQVKYGKILKWEVAANVFGSPAILLTYASSLILITGTVIYIYKKS